MNVFCRCYDEGFLEIYCSPNLFRIIAETRLKTLQSKLPDKTSKKMKARTLIKTKNAKGILRNPKTPRNIEEV